MDLLHQLHLNTWISRALAEAHQHRLALGRGLPALSVRRRLRRHARRLAASASAYDQLLRIALFAAAAHGDRTHRSPQLRGLSQPPDTAVQLALRMQALAAVRNDDETIERSVRREARRSRRIGRSPEQSATWLMEVAALNRALWDHPALPVETAHRAAILGCAARLEGRALEISRSNAEHLRLGPAALNPTREVSKEPNDGDQPVRP